jgi:hypothetical protein
MADKPVQPEPATPEVRNTSINNAIHDCSKKVEIHERQARRFMSFIIYTLLSFILFQLALFGLNAINIGRMKTFSDDWSGAETRLRNTLKKAEVYVGGIDTINEHLYLKNTINFTNPPAKKWVYKEILDSVISKLENEKKGIMNQKDSVYNELQVLPSRLEGSLIKLDGATIYIFYGIFILVFGVFTSLNRFHLKQASKYEHYMIAFQRVRIAGNNPDFSDNVRASLLIDAFTYETRSSSKRIESPIPGHPTSDVGTALLNKIMDSLDVVLKPKSERAT